MTECCSNTFPACNVSGGVLLRWTWQERVTLCTLKGSLKSATTPMCLLGSSVFPHLQNPTETSLHLCPQQSGRFTGTASYQQSNDVKEILMTSWSGESLGYARKVSQHLRWIWKRWFPIKLLLAAVQNWETMESPSLTTSFWANRCPVC